MGAQELDDDDGAPAWDGPEWDHAAAVRLVGKVVLVGITDLAPDGSESQQRQFHGHIVRADWRTGVSLRLSGARAGEELMLPPDTGAFTPAAPGEYRLRQSGEVVTDPDFLATYAVGERGRSRNR